MSEKYENLRRNRDLANWNQRRFEQEVAEEIGVGREGSRTTNPSQGHTGGSTGTVPGGRTGKESERSGATDNTGNKTGGQRPHC
ncbi:MAG: hypothetical protein Q8P31_07325 [Bacillota bacterium]|nr:hypothetical protein [Bacillota bacterium]